MSKRIGAVLAISITFAAVARPARAQTVTITLGPDAQRMADRLMIDPSQFQTLLQDQVSALWGLVDAKTFLRLSSNAQSMANKGLAADYSSSIDRFVIGFGVNLALSAGDSDLSALKDTALGDFNRAAPVAGGVQLSLLFGIKLSERLIAYVNGLAYPVSVEQFQGSGYNVGAHLQYRLGADLGAKVLAEWGGIAFTTGVELSRASMKLEDKVDSTVPIHADFDLQTSSMGSAELIQRALTIPLEVTTSLRLLYFITIYGGAGADVQLGGADATFALDSTLSGQTNGEMFANVGTARIEYAGTSEADKFIFRVMAGLGANIGPLQAFSQLNVYTRDLTVGMALGLRLSI